MPRTTLLLLLATLTLGVPRASAAQDNPFSSCQPGANRVDALGSLPEANPERPAARVLRLTGSVSIVCNDLTFSADEVVYEYDTARITATGHVSMQQKDLWIYAERAVINGQTKLGTFYKAAGTAKLSAEAPAQRSLFGTQEPDVIFSGDEIERAAPTTYRIRNGGFTTCVQPTPRWQMTGSNGTIVLDRYALLRNVVLKVKDVPILYLPAIYYPINKQDRSTGFLLPTYGSSLQRGTSLSNALFLALGRSHDATLYHDWFAKAGQAVGAEYRYVASTGSRGRSNFYLINDNGQTTGSTTSAPRRSYRIDGDANQAVGRRFRLFGRMNYFTDIATQQLYQNVYDYSQRDRSFSATLSGSIGRYRLSVFGEQRDIFYGQTPGQRTGRLPSASIGIGDKPIGRSKIYFGGTGEVTYLVRQNDVTKPTTNRSLWRFDGSPRVRAPLSTLPYLSATGSASWRLTRWLETLDPVTGEQVPVALTRQLFEMRADVTGPTLARVFQTPDSGYADRFKHVIEPAFTIQRTTPFDQFDRVVKNDYSVDALVGGVTTMQYRVTNRLLARRKGPAQPAGSPPVPGQVREILSVDISQSHYTNALAAAYDPTYQSGGAQQRASTGTFSPIQVTAVSRPASAGSVQFRMEIDAKYRAIRSMSASGTLTSTRLAVSSGWSKRLVITGLPGFDDPARADQFLNGTVTMRSRDNRFGGTYAFNLDVLRGTMLQQRIVAAYNTQCCGVSVDWQSIQTPLQRLPSDRRLGVSFTLAGIGSFSNPLGSFGGR